MKALNVKPDIKELRLSDIKVSFNNPRVITKDAQDGLKASIDKFGCVDLLVVNKRNMELISGHQRYIILKDNNIETILCVVVDVDEADQKLMTISLNNEKIMGDWTKDVVRLLDELKDKIGNDFLNIKLDRLRDKVSILEIKDTKIETIKKEINSQVTCPRCGYKFEAV